MHWPLLGGGMMSNLAPVASTSRMHLFFPRPAGSIQLEKTGAAIAAAHKSLKTHRRDKWLISLTPYWARQVKEPRMSTFKWRRIWHCVRGRRRISGFNLRWEGAIFLPLFTSWIYTCEAGWQRSDWQRKADVISGFIALICCWKRPIQYLRMTFVASALNLTFSLTSQKSLAPFTQVKNLKEKKNMLKKN